MTKKPIWKSLKPRTRRHSPEKSLQIQFVTWFGYQYPHLTLISHPMEATYKRKDLRQMGAVPGVWDMQLLLPNALYAGLWIEFKAGVNKLTKSQIAFKEKLDKQDKKYKFIICYTLDEAISQLKFYLSQPAKENKFPELADLF